MIPDSLLYDLNRDAEAGNETSGSSQENHQGVWNKRHS